MTRSRIAYNRRYYKKHRARIRRLARKRYARDKRVRDVAARYRHKHKKRLRAYAIQRRYGITPEQHQQLFVAQGGRCPVCGKWLNLRSKNAGKTYAVDHDHRTGKVRGLLHLTCNTGLGLLEDSADVLTRAAEYLRR